MEILKKYNINIDFKNVHSHLLEITGKLPVLRQHDIYAQCLSLIDLTTLNATDTEEKVRAMTAKVNNFSKTYPRYRNVAAICIYPTMVNAVKTSLKIPAVNIASVAAGFPSSQTYTAVKREECRMAVEQGADEIDIVISLSKFLAGELNEMADEIRQLKEAIGKAHLKVILETGVLSPEQIAVASLLSMEAGADFIKTSTGKLEPAATPEAAWVMTQCIKAFYEKTGKKVGFKPAGGIVSSDDALVYYAIVSHVLGSEWLHSSLFRFGASRLANNLLSSMENKSVVYF